MTAGGELGFILKKIAYALAMVIVYAIILMFLVLSLLLFYTGINKASGRSLFGFTAYSVLTGSMSPAITSGAVIVVRAEPIDRLQVGDVITYRPDTQENTLLTHRIEQKGAEPGGKLYVVTKGDANNSDDRLHVHENSIIGKVVLHINGVGNVFSFLKTVPGIITVVLLVLIWIFAIRLITGSDKKKPGAAAGADLQAGGAGDADIADDMEFEDLTSDDSAPADPGGQDNRGEHKT